MFFRKLSAEEEARFCAWAKTNYRPGEPIDGAWHPIVQRACAELNRERAVFVTDDGEESES